MMILLFFLLFAGSASAHTGTLDAYGCHSNTALYGTSAKRECHSGLLAGQVFASTTAEYKAYIAAQQAALTKVQAELSLTKADLVTCKTLCAVPKQVALKWNANTEPDLAGYRVYCGTASKVYTINVSVAQSLTATVPNLQSGTYYCAVTAYDLSNNESGFSQEVTKVIP
jgi:hypothetical protein